MKNMTLTDGPVFISNLAVLIQAVAEIIHEIDREKAEPVISDLDRASSLLGIAIGACELTVAAIEAGPDYRLDGRTAA